MLNIKSQTFFDSLSIAHKLDDTLDGFKLEEIHLFSYFASILFIYRGNLLEDWAYRFIIDRQGYPYSDELDFAIQQHVMNGFFDKQDSFYVITSRGTDEFHKFKKLPTLSEREEYLHSACTTSVLVPYSQTLRALLSDPEITKIKSLEGDRWLDQSDAFKKFEELSLAVGVPSKDLIISAVTWVNYMFNKSVIDSKSTSEA